MTEKSPFPVDGFDADALIEAGRRVTVAWMQAFSALAAEMGEFTRTRLQADWTTASKLLTSRDPREAFQCQCEAVEQAFRDYAEEAGKISRMTLEIAQAGFRLAEPPATNAQPRRER